MLGPALTLALLVLAGCQSQACFDSPGPKLVVSGTHLQLHVPSNQTRGASMKWKVKLRSAAQDSIVLTWKSDPDSDHKKRKCNPHFKNGHCFITENQTLVIEAAWPRDSGIYILETTNEMGEAKTYCFDVSVLDPVGTPLLQEQQEALHGGKCRVTLSCSTSGGGDASYGDVSYTWYRGGEQIRGPGNLSTLKEQIVGGPHTYTCKVSNFVNWANQTLRVSQGCLPESGLLPFWIITVSVTTVLLLGMGTLTCICVWRRRRQRAEQRPEESVTVYEDVNNLRTRSGHEQRQEEQDSLVARPTIYSMILAQPSDSASHRVENTLYAVVQDPRKSGSKTRKQSPSLTCTVYEKVGRI